MKPHATPMSRLWLTCDPAMHAYGTGWEACAPRQRQAAHIRKPS
jgi:hypothetical protein